jgi:hypothetical protein
MSGIGCKVQRGMKLARQGLSQSAALRPSCLGNTHPKIAHGKGSSFFIGVPSLWHLS